MINTNNNEQEVDDSQIRKQLWGGYIPVVFNITAEQITSFTQPFPYYIMIPRQSYLSLFIEKVKTHFSDFVSGFGSDNFWLSYNEVPLQWHVPAGVVFDLMTILYGNNNNNNNNNTLNLPWNLTAHFGGNFPSDAVVRCSNEEDAQWHFLNNVKECMYIRYGSTTAMMTLSNDDQAELWNSVKTLNESQYMKMKDKIHLGSKQNSLDDIKVMICLKRAQLKGMTLESFIKDHVNPTLKKEINLFLIQGIQPDGDTEMLWLLENCCLPDGFLYICCK
ncbi:hypothetical protein ABK040_001890 [Willaertia magna]